MGKPTISTPGVIRMAFGYSTKGQGNLQIYTTRLGNSEGNAMIAIKTRDALLPIRAGLLCSAWYTDARVGSASPFTPTAEAVYQPEGKMILPHLSGTTPSQDLQAVMKTIHNKMGDKAKTAMSKYIKECGLDKNDVAVEVMREVFGEPVGKGQEGHRMTRPGSQGSSAIAEQFHRPVVQLASFDQQRWQHNSKQVVRWTRCSSRTQSRCTIIHRTRHYNQLTTCHRRPILIRLVNPRQAAARHRRGSLLSEYTRLHLADSRAGRFPSAEPILHHHQRRAQSVAKSILCTTSRFATFRQANILHEAIQGVACSNQIPPNSTTHPSRRCQSTRPTLHRTGRGVTHQRSRGVMVYQLPT